MVGDGFALVANVIKSEENVYIIYRTFQKKEPYFTYPCDSSYIGTYIVSGLNDALGVSKLCHIKRKCHLFEKGNKVITTPLLHCPV